ncbi:putative iron-regulated membrane protein [Dysgonomonadaceae bacterium PH5-43]|nr:putative iron-regulated membrane protein [Dysgonomonadaceae bacterium PH5-43]
MKRLFKNIHLWLSIPFGILISVICFSGAILVFRAEIEDFVYKDLIFAKQHEGEKLSISELLPLISNQIKDDEVTGINIPSDNKRNYSISVASNPRAAIYIDAYTGEVLGKVEGTFFPKTLQFHRWLLIDRSIGKPIIGYSTLIFVIILISGIVICFPKNRKQLKRIFTIKITKSWRRFWYDLHVSAGNYVLIGLLALALTGLTWSFAWCREPFYRMFGVDATQMTHGGAKNNQQQAEKQPRQQKQLSEQQGKRPHREGEQGRPERGAKATIEVEQESYLHWDEVFSYVQKVNPKNEKISIKNGTVTVTQNKTFGNSRASDNYTFDNNTGKILEYRPYEKQERMNKVRGWIYSIHVGSWGGLFSKILTFIIAFIGGTLPLTGYYLWIKKK